MASSDEILCAGEDECLYPVRRPSHGARTEGAIFVAGVVAVQTFSTPPRHANTVARLLASTGVGANAVQWRLVECSGTKNDREELVGGRCAPIVANDDGIDDNRRSRPIFVNASAAAHAGSELREFRRQFGTRSISDCCLFALDVATVGPAALLIGALGSRFIGGMHHGISCCFAGQGHSTSIHLFLSRASCRRSWGQRSGHVVASDACNRRRRPAENHPLRDGHERFEGLSLC